MAKIKVKESSLREMIANSVMKYLINEEGYNAYTTDFDPAGEQYTPEVFKFEVEQVKKALDNVDYTTLDVSKWLPNMKKGRKPEELKYLQEAYKNLYAADILLNKILSQYSNIQSSRTPSGEIQAN